jgi:hypothetical protein
MPSSCHTFETTGSAACPPLPPEPKIFDLLFLKISRGGLKRAEEGGVFDRINMIKRIVFPNPINPI